MKQPTRVCFRFEIVASRTVLLLTLMIVCCGFEIGRGFEDGVKKQKQDSPLVVAGYLPDYRLGSWNQEASGLTDLIYFGQGLSKSGCLQFSTIPKKHLNLLADVKQKSNVRVLLTVGGWNKSQGFAMLVSDPRLVDRFVREATEFCTNNNLDGLDIDWEHPKGKDQMKGLANLLKRLKVEFAKHELLVTVAQASWQNLGKDVYRSVDRVHLMSYDHEYPHATFEKSVADVKRLVNSGCPHSKIVLGLPFYGRNVKRQAKSYRDIVKDKGNAADDSIHNRSNHNDSNHNDSNHNGFAFNGKSVIAKKVDYARKQELAGVMIWELGQDATGTHSLLKAITQTLESD